MNTYVGWPGSVHDARIFFNSDLYANEKLGELMPSEISRINNVDVPVMVLGDAAYAMLPWIMKPYSDTGTLNRKQRHFNYRLSRARMVVECAFGRLKGRWRCLLKINNCELILHQLLLMHAVFYTTCARYMMMDLLRSGSLMNKSFQGRVVHSTPPPPTTTCNAV